MTYIIIGGSVGGAIVLGTFVYGAVRRFVRMKWTPYQILLLFALTLIVPLLRNVISGTVGFAVGAGLLFVGAAIILAGSYFLRRALLNRKGSSFASNFFDRFFGAFTALFAIVLYLVIFAASALVVLQYVAPLEFLDVVYQNAIWINFGQKYALDLLLVTLVLLMVRGGYRLGFLCSLQTLLTIVFVFGALMLSVYGTLNWGFLNGLVAKLSTGLSASLGSLVGFLLAFFIVSFVFTFLLVTVFMGLNALLCIPIKRLEKGRIISAIDGSVMAVISFAVLMVVVCGFDAGVFALANGVIEGLGEFGTTLSEVFMKIESAIRGSSFGGFLYDNSPINALIN